jgi:hypothetical protein
MPFQSPEPKRRAASETQGWLALNNKKSPESCFECAWTLGCAILQMFIVGHGISLTFHKACTYRLYASLRCTVCIQAAYTD